MSLNPSAADKWQWLKLWLMLIVLFWTLVYKLSETAIVLPDFVYVNF